MPRANCTIHESIAQQVRSSKVFTTPKEFMAEPWRSNVRSTAFVCLTMFSKNKLMWTVRTLFSVFRVKAWQD